ncbi:MAG: RNA methyltransferase [Balneolales bacterium]
MSKSLITNLRKLSKKKYRMEKRQFVAEGLRTVEQILSNKLIRIDYLVFDESGEAWKVPVFLRSGDSVQIIKVNHKQFLELSDTDNPQGVLAVCRIPEPAELLSFNLGKGCLVALNRIQDPGNAGTILRTAAWFGATGMLCDEGTVDLFHPKVVRSTAGATGSIDWWEGDLETALTELESKGWETYLLDAGEQSITLKDVKPDPKSILVIGNEAGGLDQALVKPHRTLIRIPGTNRNDAVESLNASVALSVALYEFVR